MHEHRGLAWCVLAPTTQPNDKKHTTFTGEPLNTNSAHTTTAKAAPTKQTKNVPAYGRADAAKLRSVAWNLSMWHIPPSLKGLGLEGVSLDGLDDIAEALRQMAFQIESAPGPVSIALTTEDGGVPIAIARDVLTIMRVVLA